VKNEETVPTDLAAVAFQDKEDDKEEETK
jgi:hypothetical protein